MNHLRRWLTCVAIGALLLPASCAPGRARSGADARAGASVDGSGAHVPRLVVVILVDGLPQEQIAKYAGLLGPDGLRRFLDEGAWYTSAFYGHVTTYTAVGHATLLTGAYPYRHGLVANDWMDPGTGARVYCVEDPARRLLDEPTPDHAGTSPRNLEVTTVGDQLRLATGRAAKVFSLSLKDRGAILPGGKLGVAYFGSRATGRFVTTSYYMDRYPEWRRSFCATNPQDKWFDSSWEPLRPAADYDRSAEDGRDYTLDFHHLGRRFPHRVNGGQDHPSPDYYAALFATPFGNEYLLHFATACVEGEGLGRNPKGVPDLLALSFSSHDYINHAFGPESRQSQDDLLRLDQALARLFGFLDGWVGRERYLVVLTADHGFPACPEYLSDVLHLDAGRIDPRDMTEKLDAHLATAFGPGKYVRAWWNPTVYLDYAMCDARKLSRAEVEQAAAEFLQSYPGIHTVFTRTQLARGQLPPTEVARMAARTWNPSRSGDLLLIQRDGWYLEMEPRESAATHGSPWTYDTNVPLMWWGPTWIRPGMFGQRADIVDLAATLSHLLRIRPPDGCEGRVLTEALQPARMADR